MGVFVYFTLWPDTGFTFAFSQQFYLSLGYLYLLEECLYSAVLVGFNPLRTRIKLYNFISLVFLSVQYLNYISVFQLIALNIFYKQHIKTCIV